MTGLGVSSAGRGPHALTDDGEVAPRLAFRRLVTEVLGLISQRATFLCGGEPITVDGFRLRTHRPGGSPAETPAAGPHPDDTLVSVTSAGPDGPTPGTSRGHRYATLLAGLLGALLRASVPQPSGTAAWSGRWSGPFGAAGSWSVTEPTTDDFVFAFPIPPFDGDFDPAAGESHLIGAVSWVLLDTIDVLSRGSVVHADSLVVDGGPVSIPPPDPRVTLDLGPRDEPSDGSFQPLHSIAATEPAITTVARLWGLLEKVLTIDHTEGRTHLRTLPLIEDGQTAPPATFRLRDLSEWLVVSEGHPSEIYEYLARVCNVACQFCYLFGNPADLAVARGKKVIAGDEIETRLRYFSPGTRRMLFKSQWEINEFLVDPKLGHVLRTLRAKSTRDFYFITNGSPLLPRVIDLLDEVKPVTVIVSTNTIDGPLRMQVMNERRTQTETALGSLEKLAARRIPFGISFVATPDFPAERLAEAVQKIEPLRPAFVRVNLPGFTRDHPYRLPFDVDTVWERATREIADLRARFDTPLIIIPSAYEAGLLYTDVHEARITGAIPGSPAARAGFQPGDVVLRVGMFTITSRAQLQSLMLTAHRPLQVTLRRAGRVIELTFDPGAQPEYPYTGHVIGKYVFPHGLVVAPSLSTGDAQVMREAIDSTGARNPWLVTSPLMARQAESLVVREMPEHAESLRYTIVRNEHLGGNIQVLDMATVGDIHEAISGDITESGSRPDLILLPGTGFNREGRDITGRHWGDLERALGIPVTLLDVTAQFLF